MNHDIAMLTRVFKDADTLVNRIVGNKVYDACGSDFYDKETYVHRMFPKSQFCYREIEIGNVSQSKQVFEKVLFGHLYGHKKQSEIVSRIFHDLRLK